MRLLRSTEEQLQAASVSFASQVDDAAPEGLPSGDLARYPSNCDVREYAGSQELALEPD